MWFDSDAMVNLTHCPMNILIDSAPTSSVWIGHDLILTNTLCAGVFLVKNNSTGRAFLERCFEVYDNRLECQLDPTGLAGPWAGRCYEQGVMNEVAISPDYAHHVARVPANLIRNTYFLTMDTFIQHCYGGNKHVALEASKKIATTIHDLPWTKNPVPLRVCILLLAFVGTPTHQTIVDAWEATDVPLYVVDASGQNCLHAQNYICVDPQLESTMVEKACILQALTTFPLERYDMILTVRGFHLDLVHQLKYVPTGTDMVVVDDTSDCLGATMSTMSTLLARVDTSHSFQTVVSSRRSEFRTIRLPKGRNE